MVIKIKLKGLSGTSLSAFTCSKVTTETRCKPCSKLTTETPKRGYRRHSDVSIGNSIAYFERDELKHIRSTFNEINNYPHWVISKVFKELMEL